VAGIPRVSVATGSGAPAKADEGGAGPSDDLTRIRGIDPILQGRLKELGIRRYGDLAGLTTRDVKGLSEALGPDASISLDNWVHQAQVLAAGGETYYSRRIDQGIPIPDVAAPTTAAPPPSHPAATGPNSAAPSPVEAGDARAMQANVSQLRSVRSEALLGDGGSRGTGEPDDLKRIRGIGMLIENKLHSLGITSYEQIANWTGADIERLNTVLDFKGSIERENWIEQARILATVKLAESSRRS
jgi:predicted flap endonuclease-1-like 5' DNA nuclease